MEVEPGGLEPGGFTQSHVDACDRAVPVALIEAQITYAMHLQYATGDCGCRCWHAITTAGTANAPIEQPIAN